MFFGFPYYAYHEYDWQSDVNAISVGFYASLFYHYDVINFLLHEAANKYSSWKKINYEIIYYNN